jgi:phosphohistidine phosphatase
MKTLLLVRHAKTAPAGRDQSDHDRALEDRGVTDAGKLAHYLKKKGYCVDAMLVSSANRTQTTAQILLTALGDHPPEVFVSPDLYLAGDDRIWTAIQGADKAIDTLLIVGHNPGLENLSRRFLPELNKLHPGQMVSVRFNTDSWHSASELIAQDVKLV